MFTLSAKVVEWLAAFVLSAFSVNPTDETQDDTPFRDKALASLKRLCTFWELTPVADGTVSKQKGSKSVAHNTKDRQYVRVTRKGTDCPILLKPVYAKDPRKFLGYVAVPDADRVKLSADLETFALIFMSDTIKRHEDFEQMSTACTARQIGEDIRNNFAQKELRKLEKAAEQAVKVAAFVALPDSVWQATKGPLALVDSELVEYIDEQRAS